MKELCVSSRCVWIYTYKPTHLETDAIKRRERSPPPRDLSRELEGNLINASAREKWWGRGHNSPK